MNRIIDKFFPEYQLEFVGYEKDDPKEVLELAKTELETFKTLNEVRKEKGLKALNEKWADIPLNPQAVQLYSSSQGGMPGMTDMEDETIGDESAWGEDVSADEGDDGNETTENRADFGEGVTMPEGDFGKSLRIII